MKIFALSDVPDGTTFKLGNGTKQYIKTAEGHYKCRISDAADRFGIKIDHWHTY